MVAFGYSVQAETPQAGVVLGNSTPTVLSWTAPNDGQNHQVQIFLLLAVGSNLTGGAIGVGCTLASGSVVAAAAQGFAANQTAGQQQTVVNKLIAPGSTVTVQQTSGITVGAATLFASIVGS